MFSWASLRQANIISEEKYILTTLLRSHKTIVIILPTDILLLLLQNILLQMVTYKGKLELWQNRSIYFVFRKILEDELISMQLKLYFRVL